MSKKRKKKDEWMNDNGKWHAQFSSFKLYQIVGENTFEKKEVGFDEFKLVYLMVFTTSVCPIYLLWVSIYFLA